ncbi:hypothetical protein AnigIFM63604_009400 [Aspergillus niger]|uniref:NmrA-like domain-containing protein n=1 Tax=Aspergillus niger TaxID=5061 RepID=A0A9W6A642_ASPNG|nr:hypothetical protein AnigIFM63604_009400 [Aspergillus niger]
MGTPITVGVIGATGKTGRSVVDGLLSSPTKFTVTSFTREASVDSQANNPSKQKVSKLSATTRTIPWIEAAKEAGVKRSVPSEWVGPAPRGIIDIKDKKLDIPGVIQRVGLPYTLIDVGCWFQVWVPKISSGRSDHAHSIYIDHRIVGDGNQKFGLTDMGDIGKYVAQIISDARTLNRRVFAYTEVLSMNEIWDTMATVSGEIPPKDYVSEEDLREIIESCGKRWHEHGAKVDIMDVANYNMGQYRISWCIRGDNTPEFADYLGYLDFWKLFPDFPKVRSLKAFYQQVVTGACAGYGPATSE